MTTILRTYASLGLAVTAEDIIRRLIVRPFTLQAIHRDVLSTPQSPIVPSTPFTPYSPNTFEHHQNQDPTSQSSTTLEKDSNSIPIAYIIEPIGVNSEKEGTWIAGRAPGEKSVEPLAELYNKILNFISKDCGMLLDIAERSLATPSMTLSNNNNNNASSTGLLAMSLASEELGKTKIRSTNSSYEILSNVVWEEIATRLMAELGHVIFAAGRPSIFHQVSILAL